MSIESQLAAYRAKKAQENPATRQRTACQPPMNERTNKEIPESPEDSLADQRPLLSERSVTEPVAPVSTFQRYLPSLDPGSLWTWQSALKLCLWLILWGLFIELGFGAVFFVLSGFVFIYRCTSTKPRDSSHLSAYSVFNPNCERIDGTFTSEQFERELGLMPRN